MVHFIPKTQVCGCGADFECDKLEMSLDLQIACFVLPVIVLVGWIIGPVQGKEAFTLDFDAFITLILTLSVIHAYFVSSDGTSNWLAGVQLCTTYLLIALLYLFIKDSDDSPPK